MRTRFFFLGVVSAVSTLLSLPFTGDARTWVIPHVLETSGSISSQAYSFDTQLSMVSVTPIDSTNKGPFMVELYLYDNLGNPMRGITGSVCNPCRFEMDGNSSKTDVSVQNLVEANGGGFDTSVKLGYGVIVVNDPDADRLALESRIMNSLASPLEVSGVTFKPQPILPSDSPSTRAFVIPHILEKEGTIANTQYTFDTTIYLTYVPSGAGAIGATADLYLYDDTGAPLTSGVGTEVCNPCQVELGGVNPPKVSVRIEDKIQAAGGFGGASVRTGFAVLLAGGSDPDGVAFQTHVVNSHTSAFDLSVFGFEPQPIAAEARRAFVIPHVLEKSGITTDPFTFDTTIFATYTGGLAGTPGGSGAELNLYLYDTTGQPMRSATFTEVCNPCTFSLNSTNARKQSIRIDDLIMASGGFGASPVKLGSAMIDVGGADPTNVVLQTFIVNSHSGPFDLSVFGFEPQPIAAEARSGPPPTKRTFVLPHILEKSGKITSPGSFDTTIFMTYLQPPSTPLSSPTFVDLFLYDTTGQPLRGGNNQPVCAPCTYQLTTPNQKISVSMEDLVQSAGGFNGGVKLGFGVVVVSGSDPDAVNLQGFVVNSHTSAFDLSVFGFQPEEVKSAVRLLPHVFVDTLPNQLVMHWSTNSPGFVVEQTSLLSTNEWSPGPAPTIVGREYCVTNPISTGPLFFRLREP